jgi:hypothetical protein
VHPNSAHQFERKEINPNNTQITKIEVVHGNSCIRGFKFYSNENIVLKVGVFNFEMKEVKLEAGERLVGVKSRLYDNSPEYNTAHCNLVLLIGKLV